MTLTDDETTQLLESLRGRTITNATHDPGGRDPSGWCEHDSYELHLDDGRILNFSGWGHDAWGCDITVTKAADA